MVGKVKLEVNTCGLHPEACTADPAHCLLALFPLTLSCQHNILPKSNWQITPLKDWNVLLDPSIGHSMNCLLDICTVVAHFLEELQWQPHQ